MAVREEILHIFPGYMRDRWKKAAEKADKLQEIRLRADQTIMLLLDGEERYLSKDGQVIAEIEEAETIEGKDIEAILNHICQYSVYAFSDEIRQGFITVSGGHRIGVTGQVIQEDDGNVRNIKHISSMNIRVSHEIKGAADQAMPYIYEGHRLQNTLLISPPGCGKTTLLRDMVRQISNGNRYSLGMNVGVVDERSEIAGCYMGKPQNDVGIRTDVLDACPKVLGMMMLIRAMAPRVIAVDELGNAEDMKAVSRVMQCGSRMIATVHGDSLGDIMEKDFLKDLKEKKIFDRYIILQRKEGKCVIKAIYDKGFQICCGS